MNEISIETLLKKGYHEDRQATVRFDLPFYLALAVGIGLFIFSFFLLDNRPKAAFILMGISWVWMIATTLVRYNARPEDSTGGRIERYRLVSPTGPNDELCLVNHKAKTFFRKAVNTRYYSTPGS